MREFKFRSWQGRTMHYFDFDVILYKNFDPTGYGIFDEAIMQYTGLNDKNGVEIYGGDILKTGEIITKVHWVETGWYETVIKSPMNHLNTTFNITGYEACEVIGNIYENPELLSNNDTPKTQ